MLQLCAELLGTDVVGLDDDLFLIGGHSLTLVQLVGRARRAFGVALPLREAYERPTARGLAALIEELQRGSAVETAPPLVRLPRDA
jgi:acyl carrier protein